MIARRRSGPAKAAHLSPSNHQSRPERIAAAVSTCSDAGIFDLTTGECACTDPAVGTGPTCSEHTNAKTCYSNGVAQTDGSCTCSETSAGSHCQFSNKNNCNDASKVNPDGTCAQPCELKLGHTGSRCEQCDTATHDLTEDGTTVPRVATCTDLADPSTCDEPTDVLLATCVLKGNTATCDLGQRSANGECQPCEANTYADGTRLSDGADDGGIRVACKPCPANTLTRAPKLEGASFEHQCIHFCPSGQRSQNISCINCDASTFSDGLDADGASDEGYRTACKACAAGEVSDVGADVCTAKYQQVTDKQFCYGEGTDSKSKTGDDEAVFVLSHVGAGSTEFDEPWKACEDAVNLIFTTSTFVPPANFNCDSEPRASPQDCKAAADKAGVGFCDIPFNIPFGTQGQTGYPRHLCRDSECPASAGTCWNPANRGNASLPFGCVLNTNTSEVMYFTEEHANLYYTGFPYFPLCARFICPADGDNFADKPVALTKAAVLVQKDANPECKVSSAGAEARKIDAYAKAQKENNGTFIPIAFALTFLSMLGAYAYLLYDTGKNFDDLETADHKFVWFGVGLRSFDMQTDWGFYAINVKNEYGFEADYEQKFGVEEEDGSLNLAGVNVAAFQNAVLACCILGLLLTPVDMWGNRQRTLGNASKAMTISIIVLLLEDFPQLGFNIEYMRITGDTKDPIAILSPLASIGNIIYNLGLLAYECSSGEVPYLPEAPELGDDKDALIRKLKAENQSLRALLKRNGIATDYIEVGSFGF